MALHVDETTPAEVHARLRAGDQELVLLDCREHEELARGRIAGALHIPMGEVPVRCPQLDAEREIVVFCHHGVRSLSVALWLREQGFERVKSMRGGIDAWSIAVDPGVPRY